MKTQTLGRTGREVGVVGLGCWQLGGDWGTVDEDDALATLRGAAEAGVTFFDTADVYGDGRSEQLLGRFLADGAPAGRAAPKGARGAKAASPSRKAKAAPAAAKAAKPAAE